MKELGRKQIQIQVGFGGCIVDADAVGEASGVRRTAKSLDKQLIDDCWLVLLRVTVTHSGC